MAGISFAGLAPHPPILIPEIGQGRLNKIAKTKKAMEKFAEQVVENDPDLVITISPHGPVFSDAISVLNQDELSGDFSDFGFNDLEFSYPIELDFVDDLVKACNTQGITVARIDKKAAKRHNFGMKLDHGVLVPMYHLEQAGLEAPLLPLTMGMLPYEDLYKTGKIIQLLAQKLDYDVAIIASGDLSHRLSPDAPAGYNPKGEEFDQKLVSHLQELEVEEILNLDESLIKKAGECGLRPIMIMLGAIDGLAVEPNLHSYEGPLGVGYAVASYQVIKGQRDSLLDNIEQRKEDRLKEIKENESQPAKLARKAVREYLENSKVIEPFDDLPEEFSQPAGVFVSIKKAGNLRGCIGTIEGEADSAAHELIKNALKAALKDPRFDPVDINELDDLVFSVDLLSEPEVIDNREQLDPQEYGVIVEKGGKRGLLLPRLEGVETVKKQLDIARRKAGLASLDDITIKRFKVTRYE